MSSLVDEEPNMSAAEPRVNVAQIGSMLSRTGNSTPRTSRTQRPRAPHPRGHEHCDARPRALRRAAHEHCAGVRPRAPRPLHRHGYDHYAGIDHKEPPTIRANSRAIGQHPGWSMSPFRASIIFSRTSLSFRNIYVNSQRDQRSSPKIAPPRAASAASLGTLRRYFELCGLRFRSAG